jgi:tetratricopeptide (TPR) repeat protein
VKVRLIERPLPPDADAQQAEAVKIGRWLRADFVLRPFVVEGTQEPWLTVVNPENLFQPESSLETFSSPQLAVLDTLPLPEDLAQLAEMTMAITLSKRRSYKKAVQILGDLLKSKHLLGGRWALNYIRGDDLGELGNFTAAAAEYKEAIRLNPDDAGGHYNLGVALLEQGQNAAAAVEFKEAVRLNPDDAETHSNLGVALAEQGQNAAAVAEYKDAVRLNPDDANAHYNMGNALADQGQYAAAALEFKNAVRLNPDNANPHVHLGGALAMQGQYAVAIAEFKEAIRLNPDDATAHYMLGLALDEQGQDADAAAQYKEAIRLNPNFSRELPQHRH